MKANETKLEGDKRRLKEVLDASESRTVKLELQRRSLEGELQRSRLGLSDREAQAQALQDRVDSLQRQVGPSPNHGHNIRMPYVKSFVGITQSPNNPVRQVLPTSPFHRWTNRGREVMSLSKIPQLVRGRAKIRIQGYLMTESACIGVIWDKLKRCRFHSFPFMP